MFSWYYSITIFIALSINVFVQLGIILPLLSQYDLFVGSTIKYKLVSMSLAQLHNDRETGLEIWCVNLPYVSPISLCCGNTF